MALLATCAVGMAASAYAYRKGVGPFARVAPAATVAEPTTAPAVTEAKPEPPATPTTEPAPSTEPVATSPSAVVGVGAPSASASPVAAEPAGPTIEESQGLLSFEAHLTVKSSVDADVVVQGKPVGKTNQKVLTRCGPRNVRLRATSGEWLTGGQHAQITCMKHTVLSVEPTQGG